MKVLAVNWLDVENPQAGGAEIHFFEIFKRLVAAGDDVTLVCSGWSGATTRATIDGIRIHRVGGRHSFAVRGIPAIRRHLRSGAYDVVVEDLNKLPLFVPWLTPLPVYAIVPHLFGGAAFREASLPVAAVVWAAERPVPRVYRRAAFQAISESTAEELAERGVAPDRIRVIHPGVDTFWFTPEEGTRASEPTFLYVGRLKRYKGIDLAIRALAVARGAAPAIRLRIVGHGDDRSRLEDLADRLGVAGVVEFSGFLDETDKRRALREAWGLVFPSVKEGWGIANVEAAACGTPVIASDSPGLRDSVVHDRTGWLVPHGAVDALAQAMIRLAAAPALVRQLGAAGRRFAEGLSWEQTAARTREHLCETIRMSPTKG